MRNVVKKKKKHASLQAGGRLKFRGREATGARAGRVAGGVMGHGGNGVPRITNLARRGWHCPRPWQTCWSPCKRRCLRPRAGRSELSGCRWSPWPGWAASRYPSGSTPVCKLVTVEGGGRGRQTHTNQKMRVISNMGKRSYCCWAADLIQGNATLSKHPG